MSDVGRRLVDSLPDPGGESGGEVRGAVTVPVTAPSPPAPAPAPAPAASNLGESGCWEVQLLVTADRGRANALRKQVAREQNLAAWVTTTGGLYRVRAGGCLSPDGALELAHTLKGRGYPEAFRVMREAP
jgi:cell division septation protein DedD